MRDHYINPRTRTLPASCTKATYHRNSLLWNARHALTTVEALQSRTNHQNNAVHGWAKQVLLMYSHIHNHSFAWKKGVSLRPCDGNISTCVSKCYQKLSTKTMTRKRRKQIMVTTSLTGNLMTKNSAPTPRFKEKWETLDPLSVETESGVCVCGWRIP